MAKDSKILELYACKKNSLFQNMLKMVKQKQTGQ